MKTYLQLFLMVVLWATAIGAQAQDRVITGLINGSDQAVADAVIAVKDSDIKTQSLSDGSFELTVPEDAKFLIVSHPDFLTLTVELTESNSYEIVLEPSTSADLFDMSLEKLMSMEVVSASNSAEKLSEVPATMIVLTDNDIKLRGYTRLDEIFDDLPGMQVSRPYGFQNMYKNYWRGFRSNFAEPYLVMVDGLLINDLFYNSGAFVPVVPLSIVKRIEVVYGPVSSVYGANAFMGVINVITNNELGENGQFVNANISSDLQSGVYADVSAIVQHDKIKLSIAAKMQSYQWGDLIDFDNYEYTKSSYQTNSQLWGSTINAPEFGGDANYPRENKGFDLRLSYSSSEIGVQLFSITSGWGTEYPTDKALLSNPVTSTDLRIFFRHNQEFNDILSGRFLMSYRETKDDNNSWIEGYNYTNGTLGDIEFGGGGILAAGQTARILDHSTWSVYTESYLAQQSFDIQATEKLIINTGLRFEQKNIADQLDIYGNAFLVPSLGSVYDAGFLSPGNTDYELKAYMHQQKEYGVYLQTKYYLSENHIVNFGLRFDDNSAYGGNTTIRAGYVGKFGKFSGKLLYGQAYQTPIPRQLYGSWTAQGVSLTLKPEESQTFEASLNYTSTGLSATASAFHVINDNTIVSFSGGATNAGQRKVTGIDLHVKGQFSPDFVKSIQPWVYASIILDEKEKKFENDIEVGEDIIGDLSHLNLYMGVTTLFNDHIALNLMGRYIGERETVSTNPLGSIDPYFTLDASLLFTDLPVKGISIRLKANNLTNTSYFHPGIKSADAGQTPGYWQGNAWYGSTGWYSSKVPQPGLNFLLSLIYSL